jgi:hypothetical protein
MGKRDSYRMVSEDDKDWQAFWAKYPNRVAKKEARRAWAQLNPSPTTVAAILSALDWQIKAWEEKGEWYSPPYPASYIRSERWTDERRQTPRPQAGQAALGVLETLLGDGPNGRHAGPGDGDRNAR